MYSVFGNRRTSERKYVGPTTSSDLRASDVERAEAVEQLSRERTVISVDELDGARTALTVYGTAPRAVRKAFAELGRWPRSFSSAGA